jgi:nicotinate-nucleotide adenylyltransferase
MTIQDLCLGLKEVTFYGGSFNPWHEGHQACLDAFPKDQKLIIVPDYNPEKDLPNHAINFYEDLLKKTYKPANEVYGGFLSEKKKNPTYYWVKELKDIKVNLLMGADSFLNVKKWIEGEKLINLLNKIYVVPRLIDDKILRDEEMILKSINPKIEIIFLKHHDFEHISSTEIRKNR